MNEMNGYGMAEARVGKCCIQLEYIKC